jgi:hypothetical protein
MKLFLKIVAIFSAVQAAATPYHSYEDFDQDISLFEPESFTDQGVQEFVNNLAELDQQLYEYDPTSPRLFQESDEGLAMLNYIDDSEEQYYDQGYDQVYDQYNQDYDQDYEDTYRISNNQKFIGGLVNNAKKWWNNTKDHFRKGNILGGIAQFVPINKVAQVVAPNSGITRLINKGANIATQVGFKALVLLVN